MGLDWMAIAERMGPPMLTLAIVLAGIAWVLKRLFEADKGICTSLAARVGDRAVTFFDKLEAKLDRGEATAEEHQKAIIRLEGSTIPLRRAGVLHAQALAKIGNKVGADVSAEAEEARRALEAG
jgi:hypothetical protein